MSARPFVGRARERTLLRHLIGEAQQGRPAMVVVTGVPGSGKTALLGWAAAELAASGALVLHGSGSESSLPLSALARLLQPIPELAAAVRAGMAGDVAFGIADALVARARRRLVAVLLDDVGELEQASRDALDHVLTTLDDEAARHELHLLVVLTAREPLDPDGLADRVLRLDAARALALGGLDEEDVFELVAATGRRPDPALVTQLLEDTGGLPLLVESSLEHSPRVRGIADLVGRGLELVDASTRDLLQFAAALGEPWDPAELADVAGRARAAADEQLAAAEHARLVQRDGDAFRFTHPLVRTVLLERLPTPDRRAVHRTIAERLRARVHGGALPDDVLVRVADHLVRARPDVAPWVVAELADRAGRVALGWGAWQQASRLLGASAEAFAETADVPAEAARRHLDAARAAYFDNDADRCEAELASAMALAERAGTDEVRLHAALLLVRTTVGERPLRPGQRPDTEPLERALTGDGLDRALVVEANAALAEAWFVSGETERALETVASARALAAGIGEGPSVEEALCRLDIAEGLHRLALLELDDARRCFDRAARHAAAAGSTLLEIGASTRRCLVDALRGDVRAASDEVTGLRSLAAHHRFWGEAAFATTVQAHAAVLAGDRRAATVVDEAARLQRRSGHAYTAVVLTPVAVALRARTTGLAGLGEGPLPSVVRALAAVEADDADAARATLAAAGWRHGVVGPVTINTLGIAVALVEVGDLLDDAGLVKSGAEPLRAAAEAGVLTTVGWPATVPRLLAAAARHEGDLDLARRHVEHGLALAERQGLGAEHGRALLELAHVDAAAGNPAGDVAAVLGAAAERFRDLSMHGWVSRCERTAARLGVALHGAAGAVSDHTIFTTDVVGSTEANARLGDALYVEQLHVHDRLLRGRLSEFRGEEIKHTGDGLNAVFLDPVAAARCGLAAQDDFARWKADEPELALEVRCGIARGRLIPVAGDFFGLVQSEAARLCGMAAGGEVLVSAAVAGELAEPDVVAEALGARSLRGLPAPIEVYRLHDN